MIDFTKELLFPYQVAIIKDKAKYVALQKSRRIGGTFIFALKAILESLDHDWDAWFSSNDDKNGKEFIRYVKQWCETINLALGTAFFNLAESTTEMVLLPNGKRISQVSSAPNALRAKDGIIILDEMAHRDDQIELYTAAQGCIIQRGKIYIVSSHNGPATVFYDLINDPAKGFSVHKVTLTDAVAQGYAVRFASDFKHLLPDIDALNKAFVESVKAGCLSEDAYKQEFMCEPVSLASIITAEQYDSLTMWDVPDKLDPKENYNSLYAGLDVGRVHDLTVLWIIEEYKNNAPKGSWDQYDYKTVCIKAIKNTDIPTQMQMLRPLIAHKSIKSCLVDQGTVGRSLSDALCSEFSDRCKPFSFSAKNKGTLGERVAGFIQHKKISLPKDDKSVREQFLTIRRQVGPKGNVQYDGRTKDNHCDAFWACAMALESCANRTGLTIVGMQ